MARDGGAVSVSGGMEARELSQRDAKLQRDDAEVEFSRVVAFSDGVFAIAITLLVLSLQIPASVDELSSALSDQVDELVAYAISFAVVGKLWLSHHRFYGSLDRFDNTLMGLNLLYLAWVVLVPFSSDLLGNYGEEPISVIIYACIMVGASLTFQIQILYAFRNGLVREADRALAGRYAGPANLSVVAVFLASIPVALVNAYVAQAMWLAIFVLGSRIGDWLARRGTSS
jgi:uncharacterized membrane protein